MSEALTLSKLNQLVKRTIEQNMDYAYWVQAEISSLSIRGHCYIELIENDEHSNTPIAKARANCWANQWSYVSNNFLMVTGTPLKTGMKVLLLVRPTFHESFGFAWNIINIDPTFTIGDMQRRREEILKKLKDEGVFGLQKELPFSPFAKNIAVISAENAAGYGDFCRQLHDNSAGFAFKTELFTAVMQGENVEQSVIKALNRVFEHQEEFDCVVIIRGGGATSDLSGFDSLELAENVAQFPLPIITGIGHERDNCVLDYISYLRVKTPTAAAVMLIENLMSTLEILTTSQERICRTAQAIVQKEQLRIQSLAERIPALFSVISTKEINSIDTLYTKITNAVEKNLDFCKHTLRLYEEKQRALDPELLLKRGYSMTFANGKLLVSSSQITEGDIITTRFKDGEIRSCVRQCLHPTNTQI